VPLSKDSALTGTEERFGFGATQSKYFTGLPCPQNLNRPLKRYRVQLKSQREIDNRRHPLGHSLHFALWPGSSPVCNLLLAAVLGA
jgi:hypothetical protein